MKASRARTWSGVAAGAALGLLGPMGAAVGIYPIPEPESVGVHAYARVAQWATAHFGEGDESGETQLEIMVLRAPYADHSPGGNVDGTVHYEGHQGVSVGFYASYSSCVYTHGGDVCDEREWGWEEIPADSFTIDPALNSARLHLEHEDGCTFDVEWTARTGVSHGHGRSVGAEYNRSLTWGAHLGGRVGRTAEVRIDSCVATLTTGGTLLVEPMTDQHGRVGFREAG